MTTFHWVRHGPTHDPNFVGWRDVPADLSGTGQIARLDQFLPRNAVITSSDLRRAFDTATAIGAHRERIPPMPGLREFHFGNWDGQSSGHIRQSHTGLSRAYWQTPGDIAPPGGESWNMAARRVSTAADHLARLHKGRDIVIVAHFGAILTQLQRAIGCSAREVLEHKIDNLSVTSIRNGNEVLCINHIA